MPITKIWENGSIASFEVEGYPRVTFPIWDQLEESAGIRSVPRQVPWVNYEQVDETGLKSPAWTVQAPFSMEIANDPGLGDSPPLYPTRLEKLIELFETRKTGTLNLPWKRNIRCKAVDWRRIARTDMVDSEVLQITFLFDNENKLDQQKALAAPASTARQLAIKAQFEAQRAGSWDGSWEDLTRLTAQLEAVMNAPSEYRQDVAARARRVASCCDRLLTAHSQSDVGRSGLADPAATPAVRLLHLIRAQAESAEAEAREGGMQVVTRTVERAMSLWEFAVAVGVDPYELMVLNPQIEDPNYVPKGTQIKVAR